MGRLWDEDEGSNDCSRHDWMDSEQKEVELLGNDDATVIVDVVCYCVMKFPFL